MLVHTCGCKSGRRAAERGETHGSHRIYDTLDKTYVGKGNLGRGSLLQQQAAVTLVKEKDGKGPMEDGAWLLGRKDVRLLFTRTPNDVVLVIEHQNRILLHQISLGQTFAPLGGAVGGISVGSSHDEGYVGKGTTTFLACPSRCLWLVLAAKTLCHCWTDVFSCAHHRAAADDDIYTWTYLHSHIIGTQEESTKTKKRIRFHVQKVVASINSTSVVLPLSLIDSFITMTTKWRLKTLLFTVGWFCTASAFQSRWMARGSTSKLASSTSDEATSSSSGKKKDNKAMAFLRKIGRVGGPKQDFTHVIGVDEGSVGKSASSASGLRKTLAAFRSCTETGIIDDLTETFPTTTCGTVWSGFTDQVMGGASSAILTREPQFHGRTANVLRGRVTLENNGGFIQMATNLAKDSKKSPTVDASGFDGVEVDVLYDGLEEQESFNIHLKTQACSRPFSSYRATFQVPHGKWTTVRLPWNKFVGNGPGASEVPFDRATLTRVGLVAIGKPMERLVLALSGMRLYKDSKKIRSSS